MKIISSSNDILCLEFLESGLNEIDIRFSLEINNEKESPLICAYNYAEINQLLNWLDKLSNNKMPASRICEFYTSCFGIELLNHWEDKEKSFQFHLIMPPKPKFILNVAYTNEELVTFKSNLFNNLSGFFEKKFSVA